MPTGIHGKKWISNSKFLLILRCLARQMPLRLRAMPNPTFRRATLLYYRVDAKAFTWESVLGPQPTKRCTDPAPRGDEDIRWRRCSSLRRDSLTSRYPLSVDVDDGVVPNFGNGAVDRGRRDAADLVGNLPAVVDVVDDTTLEPA